MVEKVLEWPGIHAARQLVHGEPLTGVWFDRRREWAAWRGNEPERDKYRFATRYEIELAPLPCWRHLDSEAYRDEVARLIGEIEAAAAAERESAQKEVLGVSAVLDQNPLGSPKRPKKSPRPLVHAATRRVRDEFWTAYREFEAAYADAAERLRERKRNIEFPDDCFPPALPFTGDVSKSPLPPPMKEEPLLTTEGEPTVAGREGCTLVRMRTFWWSSATESASSAEASSSNGTPTRARGQPP